jgi:hypothetical protein
MAVSFQYQSFIMDKAHGHCAHQDIGHWRSGLHSRRHLSRIKPWMQQLLKAQELPPTPRQGASRNLNLG